MLRHKWLQLFFKRMSSPSKLSSPQDEAVVDCLLSVRRTQCLCIFSHCSTETLLQRLSSSFVTCRSLKQRSWQQVCSSQQGLDSDLG